MSFLLLSVLLNASVIPGVLLPFCASSCPFEDFPVILSGSEESVLFALDPSLRSG